MAVSDTLINQVFDKRYRVVRKLGAGGMANVYLAEDQELGRRVAIKILNERHANDDQFVERFRREAKNAAGLSHPNIVSIYDRGEAEGTYYIAMEFLDGRTLKELIVSRGPTPIRIAIDYTRQILAAVGFAHRHGIVHRDIKPHNVLVGDDGRLKVTDFGIARSGASQMTEVGSIIGTAQYLSPEQARGAAVDQTSDLYSVGIVLYEMLTGAVPFTGDTPLEIAMKHLSAVPEPPSANRADVPEGLDQIVLRALAKNPPERYQSAEEMDADLARVARGLGVAPATAEAATTVLAGGGAVSAPTAFAQAPTTVSKSPPPVDPAQRRYYEYEPPTRRRRRPFWPWLLVLCLLAGAGAGGWYVYKKIEHKINANEQVTVQYYVSNPVDLAVRKIKDAGLRPIIRYRTSLSVAPKTVIDQSPSASTKTAKGNPVTLYVSSGKPKAKVPDVRGKLSTDAVAQLTALGLKANVVPVHSDKQSNTVTGQFPRPGRVVEKGTEVRINVSQGPTPVAVPPEIGHLYDQAASELQAAGFAVARVDVDSNEAKNTVLSMNPAANSEAPKGSKVTLTVSKGPTTSSVPPVESLDQATAVATLRNSGFVAVIQMQDVNDPTQNRIVLTQDPAAGTQAKPHSPVTITVGHYVAPPPPPTTAATTATVPTTDTTTTDTTTTDTTTVPAP